MSDVWRLRPGWKLALLVSIYLILAVTYSVVVPIGQGADEWAHYWYAQFIAGHGRLPASPAEREVAGYKSDWPPLYHLSAAVLTAWIDTTGPPTFRYRADPDHIRRQIIPAPPSEAILHTEDELFPWRQEILVWHLGRFLSIVFSLGTLLVTYRIALEVLVNSKRELEPSVQEALDRRGGAMENVFHALSPQTLALVCVAFLAFIPRFLFTGMLFNYDSLTLLLASLFLWLAVRVAKGYYPRWGFWALGGLAGLALLAKYLTALLPLEIVLLALYRGEGDGEEANLSPLPPRSPAPVPKIGQAALAFLLVTSGWFGYLLVNFNEIDRYGPVLGTLAPLLRGDGSDRTVEQIFAAISGGQAPPPAHIDQQHYSTWQIFSEFFMTFWINPTPRPSPLNWFVGVMTLIALLGIVGLAVWWRRGAVSPRRRLIFSLLLLHCLLPVPFMLVRLFGARDALEAVQGRHILFLAGPAIVVMLVWGLSYVARNASRRSWSITHHASRITFHGLIGLLLVGAISQLIYMAQVYPPPLPIRTTPYPIEKVTASPASISLKGGAALIGQSVTPVDSAGWPGKLFASSPPTALKVDLIWQAGPEPAPEDYLLELALVDGQGQIRSDWLAYQTQARYPTRTWEPGDTIRDEGWLPIQRLEIGDYQVRMRLVGVDGPLTDWQTLSTYTVTDPTPLVSPAAGWLLWQEGQIVTHPPTLQERQTAQFTFADSQLPTGDPQLVDPDGNSHAPASVGEQWANFIIGPDWPPGDYRWQPNGRVVLRVGENSRNFQPPVVTHPLEANFGGEVKLLGYDLPTRRVQPGEGLPVTLYWQGLRWMGEDFVIFERLLDNQGRAWGGYDRRAKENHSTLFWAPGEIVTDGFAVPVAADAPDGAYNLSLGWYHKVEGEAQSLPILDPVSGQPAGTTAITIGPIKVGGPPPGVTVTQAVPQNEFNIILGEQIKLLGYDLSDPRIDRAADEAVASPSNPLTFQPSDTLHLTLYWQALTPSMIDYTVFVHLRNAAGETAAQKDSPPVDGAYPTSLWDAGEIIKDEIVIPLENVTPGQYDLVVGMYDFQTGLRLAVPENLNNEIVLSKMEVDTP